MKQLFTMDLKNYDENAPRFYRPSVRGIIINNRKVAMVHSLKYDYYKFPGGGIESGESHIDALIREVLEETGLTVIPASISEYGSVHRIQKSSQNENEVFDQENFYYLCEVTDDKIPQNLDDYENDERFTLEYVMPMTAIMVNRAHDHTGADEGIVLREAHVRELLMADMMNGTI